MHDGQCLTQVFKNPIQLVRRLWELINTDYIIALTSIQLVVSAGQRRIFYNRGCKLKESIYV